MTFRRPLAALLLAATLAGCGTATQPNLGGARAAAELGALGLELDVDRQIASSKVAETERGVQVKLLPKVKQKAVTFFSYKALDNSLASTLPQHINVLEKGGSSANVNAVVFADDDGPDNTFVYYVRQDQDANQIVSPYVPADPAGKDMDSGNPSTLRRATRWAFHTYPASFRWLDINNHGGGYYGIAQDDTSNRMLRLPELAQAIKVGAQGKVDLLSFDACLMGTAEVAYELRDSAKVMVASEDSSYAVGMNYDVALAKLARNGQAPDPKALGRQLVVDAQRKGKKEDDIALFSISAIDLSKADEVAKAVDKLAGALLAAMPRQAKQIQAAVKETRVYHVSGADKSDFGHRDLYEFVQKAKQRVQDPAVQQACAAFPGVLFNGGGAILFSRQAKQQNGVARGLGIYLPTEGQIDPIYKDTGFAKATRWDEFLAALGQSK